MDVRDRRDLYNGFGETLARAVELVAVPALFGLLGHLLDRRLGTGAVLTVGLLVFALAGMFVRSWYAYDTAMKRHEDRLPRPGKTT